MMINFQCQCKQSLTTIYIHVDQADLQIKFNMMEPTSQQDFDQKYEALLNQYNRVKDQIKEMQSAKTIDIQIEKYDQLLDQIQGAGSELTTQASTISDSNQQEKIVELKAKIAKEEEELTEKKNKNALNETELEERCRQKEDELRRIKQQGQSQDQELEIKSKISMIDELDKDILAISQQFSTNEQTLKDLESRIQEEQREVSFILEEADKQTSQRKQKEEDISNLKNKIDSQNRVLEDLLKQLRDLNSQQNQGPSQEDLNNQKDLKQKIANINKKIQSMNKEIKQATNKYNKSLEQSQKQAETDKKKQEDLQEKKRKIHETKQKIEKMKVEREQLEEEKKNKKKKPTLDYKQETIKFEKLNKILEEQLERQVKMLNEYTELRKTYVKTDDLVKAKEELERYRVLNKGFETDVKKLEKLEETAKTINDSIKKLRNTEARIINEKEQQLAQTKSKLKQLIESKTFYEKNISHCKNKLGEYMKEYPDHDKNQQEQREARKRKAAEQKKRLKAQELKALQESKKNKNKNNDDDDGVGDEALIGLKQPEKGNGESLAANPTVQIVAGGAVVLALVAAYNIL